MNNLSELRRVLWPIEWGEYKKFMPMALMMMFILFNYSLLRSVKDGLIVTQVGPEAISFMKTYIVLPAAILSMIIYAKLCNAVDVTNVFYVVTSFFAGYLVLFALYLYPNQELIHPSAEAVESLVISAPYFKWFFKIWGKWSFASFYVIAELWGSMMLSLLFWQFANQITRTTEAKRFYSMFGVIGNIGLLLTGYLLGYFYSKAGGKPDNNMISNVTIVAAASAGIIMFLYYYVNNAVITDPQYYNPEEVGGKKKKKAKLSLSESFHFIFTSKYIGLIAVLVLAYGISVNLVEGVWKAKIRDLYPTAEGYSAFMGEFQKWQGIAAIAFMFVGSNILRRVSWQTAAMFTPLMMLVTGLAFFAFVFFGDVVSLYLTGILAYTPLQLAVMVGTAQNVLAKATKYSLFDATKEMSYIPLDEELKTKGKAAVDVVGGRLGKSGGGFIQSTFFLLIPSLTFDQALPYFAAIFFVIVVIWTLGVRALSKEYQALVKDHSY